MNFFLNSTGRSQPTRVHGPLDHRSQRERQAPVHFPDAARTRTRSETVESRHFQVGFQIFAIFSFQEPSRKLTV